MGSFKISELVIEAGLKTQFSSSSVSRAELRALWNRLSWGLDQAISWSDGSHAAVVVDVRHAPGRFRHFIPSGQIAP